MSYRTTYLCQSHSTGIPIRQVSAAPSALHLVSSFPQCRSNLSVPKVPAHLIPLVIRRSNHKFPSRQHQNRPQLSHSKRLPKTTPRPKLKRPPSSLGRMKRMIRTHKPSLRIEGTGVWEVLRIPLEEQRNRPNVAALCRQGVSIVANNLETRFTIPHQRRRWEEAQ